MHILSILAGLLFVFAAGAQDGYRIKHEETICEVLCRFGDKPNSKEITKVKRALEHVQAWPSAYAEREGIRMDRQRMPARIVFADEIVGYKLGLLGEGQTLIVGYSDPKHDRILVTGVDLDTLYHEFAHWFFSGAASHAERSTRDTCEDFAEYCAKQK